jgi:porin
MGRPYSIFRPRLAVVFIATGLLVGAVQGIRSQEEDSPPGFWQRETLSGDWGGWRTDLEDAGLSFELVYTGEVYGNVSGGLARGARYVDNFDLVLAGDLEQLVGWSGGSFLVYGLGNNGGVPSDLTGDLQIQSNIEAPRAWRLYEAWLEQTLFDDRLSIKAGLYDLNAEFDVNETGSLFLNSSHGIGADFAQSGVLGPSVFPVTSLAARVRWTPLEDLFVQGAILDGVPGDPKDLTRTAVILSRDDGLLLVGEIGYLAEGEALFAGHHETRPGRRGPKEPPHTLATKLALGTWAYTAEFEDVLRVDASGQPVEDRGNWGLYVLGEQAIYSEPTEPGQGLSLFLRLGYADPRFNQLELYSGGGLVSRGLIPGRDRDQVGFAVAAGHNGSDFEQARQRDGLPVDDAEVALEWTYRWHLLGWATVQGDVFYIVNPGATAEVDDAFGLMLRFEIVF